jgi:methylated-DNA-protein-cysteine methyltransferase-like protein
MSEIYRDKIYRLVRRIPKGKVMTYGQLAVILGKGYTARTVGHAMKVCDTDTVPWQRVINSRGACSTGRLTLPENLQQKMLEDEGVIFSTKGRCDLNKFLWEPKS